MCKQSPCQFFRKQEMNLYVLGEGPRQFFNCLIDTLDVVKLEQQRIHITSDTVASVFCMSVHSSSYTQHLYNNGSYATNINELGGTYAHQLSLKRSTEALLNFLFKLIAPQKRYRQALECPAYLNTMTFFLQTSFGLVASTQMTHAHIWLSVK